MLMVAQLVEHQVVILEVVSSILIHQPNLKKKYTMIRVAKGCYFEQEEDEPIDPIKGKKTSANIKEVIDKTLLVNPGGDGEVFELD